MLAWDNNELRGTMKSRSEHHGSTRSVRDFQAAASGAEQVRIGDLSGYVHGVFGLVPDIKDFEPLIGRWRQIVDAPRHVEEKVEGDMTLEWLRDRR